MLLCFSLHHSSVPQCSKDKKKKKKEKTPSACLKSLCDLGPAYLRSPVSWNTIYCRPIQLHCVVPTPNSLRALSSCPWLRCCAYYSLYWGHIFPISVWLCSSLRSQLRWYFFFLANLSSFKCGLNIHLMSSHDESPSISLQYLVTAFFLLCIPHWTVGSERAGVGFLLHMVSPARLSKLGTIGCSVILTELSWIEWNT